MLRSDPILICEPRKLARRGLRHFQGCGLLELDCSDQELPTALENADLESFLELAKSVRNEAWPP